MKIISGLSLVLIFIGLSSCKSYLVNAALENEGIYDDEIKLHKMSNNEKEIIFFPMHHLGTALFYEDVKEKVDSLKKEGYYFYKEGIKLHNKKDTVMLIKAAKFQRFQGTKKNYKGLIDSIFKENNIKPKKNIIYQPKYVDFGLDSTNSIISDPSLENLLDYYESLAGEIPVSECDLKYGPDKFYKYCPKYALNAEQRKLTIQTYRNQNLLERIRNDKHKKIALVYGSKHIDSLKILLKKFGYRD